jgi:hypothetical protein
VWQASLDCRLACRVLSSASTEHLAEDYFIYLGWIDTRLLQQMANDGGT